MLWIEWRRIAQRYSLDCANTSDAASTEYIWAVERMAVKTQLEMTGPLCLELAHLAPSLVPCSVCSPCQFGYPRKNDVRSWGRREFEGHAKIEPNSKWQKMQTCICSIFYKWAHNFPEWQRGQKGLMGKRNGLTGREKISHRFLQSQHPVGSQQQHCWPPTSMWQGCLPPWFYLHLVSPAPWAWKWRESSVHMYGGISRPSYLVIGSSALWHTSFITVTGITTKLFLGACCKT